MTALILHDWSPYSDACVNCGQMRAGATVECTPTTAEPGCDEADDD